jgi:hypothetical protein
MLGLQGPPGGIGACQLINQGIVYKQRCSWVWIAEVQLGVESRDGAGSASWD